ncbi:VaFE repeat-containing surface-anchored protein [Lactococcus formosensis]|uniref:VaFE repeat-containing surface-anchored protein n=1 Tax=Lactococcus formosensis TaxID=1281486 RepID=UPI0039F6C6E5
MNRKKQALLGLLILIMQVFVAPLSSFAATTPSGSKTFAPIGASNGSWNDGVPLGGSYLHIDNDGIITGFAQDASGNDWNGQKFKNITDNIIAYCLNFNQASPNGSSTPLDDLTQEQKRLLNNLLKLGYVENGSEVYKGQGVATLSNIDAFTTTQWMVHEIVPTWDMSQFTITNPQLAAGVANLSQWIHEDLSIQLQKDGNVIDDGTNYSQKFILTAPHDLQGNATITLSKDIAGAKIVTNSGTFDISSSVSQLVNVGESFEILVPNSTATDSINVIAKGGTTSFTFMKYDRPSANQQQSLVVGEKYISDDEVSQADFQWETLVPEIGTTATDKADGDKVLDPDQQVTINDEVKYSGLTPGKEYTVNGVLMDKETGKALEVDDKPVTGTTTFTPETSEGSVNVEFTFNASALKGKTIVVFEKAYQGEKEVATHEDINDEGQTVVVANPEIGTTATDKADGDKVLDPDQQVTINDEVKYSGLTPGKEYTVNGVLMDKETGKALEVDDKPVTGTTTFTPETSEGSVNVEFTFNASALKGKTIVVFEKAYQGEKEVATHEDINDEGQTVVVANPEIGTTATDKADGDKVLDPDQQVTINDEVKYSGLTPGKEYTVNGVLMDKETGKALEVDDKPVTGTTTFTPETSEGSVNVEFTFNASALKGKTIVVFEKAYQGEKEVATHEDINDEGQTVVVANPEIGTTATDKADGDKVLDPDQQVTINDEVKYSGLTPGKEYTVNGVLMDKETGKALEVDGKPVTGTTTFTPETSEGSVNVEFTFNASALKGKTIVVFEKAYQGEKEVATHEDINDEGQTVVVDNPKSVTPPSNNNANSNTNLPSTGENSVFPISLAGLVIIIAAVLFSLKRKNN